MPQAYKSNTASRNNNDHSCRIRRGVGWVGVAALAVAVASCGGGGSGGAVGGGSSSSSGGPTPPQVTLTYIHNFRSDLGDGGQPNGPLMQANDGNFYGTTRSGSFQCQLDPNDSYLYPCGVIFKMTPGGIESVLHPFGSDLTKGFTPAGPLIQGQDGALYGVTASGGAYGGGAAYRITLDGMFTVLHSFPDTPDEGWTPFGGLVQASDGNFYGITVTGGANHCDQIPLDGGNCGTVYRMTPAGEVTTLHSFGASASDGIAPNTSLVLASDGYLYGTTTSGGENTCSTAYIQVPHTCGTLFRVSLNGDLTILHSFGASFSDGIAPQSALIQATDGALYGTTSSGGDGVCGWIFGCGTVFKMTLAGDLSILHTFSIGSRLDGDGPWQLIQAEDGYLYGITGNGGGPDIASQGTIFRMSLGGDFTTLYTFAPMNVNPTNPMGGLVQGTDGAFYGVTTYSDNATGAGAGTVFKLVVQ